MIVESRMQALLHTIPFDFSQFTMDRFVAWLEAERGRKIAFIPWEMPPGMFGVWMSDADEPIEHIFIEKDVPPLHQVHIQLHELSHILCNHPTMRLSRCEMQTLLLQSIDEPAVLREALLRAPAKEEMEQEAELLAAFIQHEVITRQGMSELSVSASSDQALVAHFAALELL